MLNVWWCIQRGVLPHDNHFRNLSFILFSVLYSILFFPWSGFSLCSGVLMYIGHEHFIGMSGKIHLSTLPRGLLETAIILHPKKQYPLRPIVSVLWNPFRFLTIPFVRFNLCYPIFFGGVANGAELVCRVLDLDLAGEIGEQSLCCLDLVRSDRFIVAPDNLSVPIELDRRLHEAVSGWVKRNGFTCQKIPKPLLHVFGPFFNHQYARVKQLYEELLPIDGIEFGSQVHHSPERHTFFLCPKSKTLLDFSQKLEQLFPDPQPKARTLWDRPRTMANHVDLLRLPPNASNNHSAMPYLNPSQFSLFAQ